MATHSNGISALQLQKQLGLGSYKSAWLLCAKLRRAMVAPGRAPLAGLVEVDETEIPLRTKTDPVCGGGGRSPQGKMFVAGAVEVENDAPGRLRLAAIKDFSAASLHGFVAANVAPGATIKTDGWPSYARAPDVRHEPHVVGAMAAHAVLPWVHRAFSNAKTWALGVYHGLRRQHLQSYLDEFAFRFNRRRTRHAAFRSLLAIALVRKPLTYNMLIMPEAQGFTVRENNKSLKSLVIQARRPDSLGDSPVWTNENRGRYDRSKLRYPSDLTDEEWALSEPLIPAGKRGGNRRTVNVREVVNGLMYVLSTGCQWRAIPKDLPPRSTVYDYFDLWSWDGTLDRIHEALYRRCREEASREASPTAAIIDSQSVKSAEKGGPASIRAVTMQARRSRARSGTFLSIRKAS